MNKISKRNKDNDKLVYVSKDSAREMHRNSGRSTLASHKRLSINELAKVRKRPQGSQRDRSAQKISSLSPDTRNHNPATHGPVTFGSIAIATAEARSSEM